MSETLDRMWEGLVDEAAKAAGNRKGERKVVFSNPHDGESGCPTRLPPILKAGLKELMESQEQQAWVLKDAIIRLTLGCEKLAREYVLLPRNDHIVLYARHPEGGIDVWRLLSFTYKEKRLNKEVVA